MDTVTLIFRIFTLLMPIIQQVIKEIMDDQQASGQVNRLYANTLGDDELTARIKAHL